VLFTPPPLAALGDGIQLSFDLVGFTPDDDPNGQVALEEYHVDLLNQALVDAGMTEIGGYDFTTGTQDWSFLGLNLLGGAPATGEYDPNFAALEIASSPDSGGFGFWQSPTGPTIAGATIYQLLYRVSGDTSTEELLGHEPLLRLRSASENGQYTFLLEINRNEGAKGAPPFPGSEPEIIPLYLYPHPLLAGDGLKYAFDLLDFDDDATTRSISLHELQILSGPDALLTP